MKVQLTATELQETSVGIVSLVKRGANRIPFRLIKEDNSDMLNFDSLGKQLFAKSEAPKKGGVLAVIINKSADDVEGIKAVLTTAGLNVTKSEDGEGILIFKQEGVEEFSVGTVKLDDNVAIVVSGLQKGFSGYDWNSTDFKDVFSSEGFYPTFNAAQRALSTTVENILYKTEDKNAAATAVTKALSDFSSLISTLTNALPEAVFKAETGLVEFAKAEKKVVPPVAETDEEKAKAAAAKKADAAKTVPDTGTVVVAEKTEEEKAAEIAAETLKTEGLDATTIVIETAKSDDELFARIAAMVSKTVTEAIEGVTAQIETVKAETVKANEAATAAADAVKKTEETLRGTVPGTSTQDRTTPPKTVTKSDGAPPLLDTAFGRAH